MNFCARVPFPPSVNHLYKRGRRGVYIDKKGQAWFQEAILAIQTTRGFRRSKFKGRLLIEVWLVPPSAHKYDLDNRLKALFDSIQQSGLIQDDAQFYRSTIHKYDKQPGGKKDAGGYFTITDLGPEVGQILDFI